MPREGVAARMRVRESGWDELGGMVCGAERAGAEGFGGEVGLSRAVGSDMTFFRRGER